MKFRMPAGSALSVALLTSLLLSACATMDERFGKEEWYQKTREVSGKAVSVTRSTASTSIARMQKYMKDKDMLQAFHDAGEHSEAAVLDVLHRAGIKRGKKPTTSQQPAKPVTPSPGQKPIPVPEQYTGKYRWPLNAGIISSDYGARWDKQHEGIDIAADMNEPVYAVAAGQVIYSGNGLRGYGNVVILKHDSRVTSLYAHNSELKVKLNDVVKQGDLIALLGSTGRSTGPHVHFEFRDGDAAVNPHTLLPNSDIARTASAAVAPGK